MEAECGVPKAKRARAEASEHINLNTVVKMDELKDDISVLPLDVTLPLYGTDHCQCNIEYALYALDTNLDYTFKNFWKTGTTIGTKIPEAYIEFHDGPGGGIYRVPRHADVIFKFHVRGSCINKIKLFNGDIEFWGMDYHEPVTDIIVAPFHDGVIPLIQMYYNETFVHVYGSDDIVVNAYMGFLDDQDRRRLAVFNKLSYTYYNPSRNSWSNIKFLNAHIEVTDVPTPDYHLLHEKEGLLRNEYRNK